MNRKVISLYFYPMNPRTPSEEMWSRFEFSYNVDDILGGEDYLLGGSKVSV